MENTYTYTELKNLTIEFSKLKDNWDGYKAIPPEPCILVYLVLLIEDLETKGFNPNYIDAYYPNPHGTLQLDLKKGDKKGTVEVGIATWRMDFNGLVWDNKKHEGEMFDIRYISNTIKCYVE